jgi:hypothetical protein
VSWAKACGETLPRGISSEFLDGAAVSWEKARRRWGGGSAWNAAWRGRGRGVGGVGREVAGTSPGAVDSGERRWHSVVSAEIGEGSRR